MVNTTTALPVGSWKLHAVATTVTVAVPKMGMMNVPADLTVTSGTIDIDDNHNVVNVDVVVDAASYSSKNAKRNKDVLSKNFLDSETYPTISFRTGAVAASDGGYKTNGTVTIKGQSSPIDVTVSSVQFADDSGSFTATATVDRKTIGVDKLPTFIIGRNLELTVSAKVTKTA
jgi:polyisoprenoid-binding protein YceI